VLINDEVDAIRGRGASVTGPARVVDSFVETLVADGVRELGAQTLGQTKQVSIFGELDGSTRSQARALGLDLGNLPLQDLFVHLTDDASKREIRR
jgi:ABC-2 type transport system ATP-binding protein